MVKITIDVEGMACGMCEAHVNDALRKTFKVRKVESSFRKKRTQIIAEESIIPENIKSVIEQTGYKVGNVKSETYEKKEFSLFKKKK